MKIRIKLLSDLLTASGEGTGFIDTDVTYDEYGLPYIPAKRIKGLLKEAALEIQDVLGSGFNKSAFNRLFGIQGKDKSGNLRIDNGRIDGYWDIVKELKRLKKSNLKEYFHQEKVLNYFTYTRTQTSIDIETNVAKENSLRTLRVIKKKLNDGTPMEFYVEIDGVTNEDIELLRDSVKVLRHMGVNRTRGLGEVKCELIIESEKELEEDKNIKTPNLEIQTDSIYKLPITYRLMNQLFVTNGVGDNQTTLNYIPGSNLVGALASRFIQEYKLDITNAHKDKTFKEIFLDEKVKFLNAYITDDDNNRLLPIPASIVKKKDDKELIFDLANESHKIQVLEEDIQTTRINGYYSLDYTGDITIKNPETKVEFHHRRPEDRSVGHATINSGEFFQFEVLKENQTFKSYLIGGRDHLELLRDLMLKKSTLFLGRSKTAQYAKVEIELEEITKFNDGETNREGREIEPNSSVVVTLTSPMILLDKYGVPKPDPKILEGYFNEINEHFTLEDTFIKTINVSGFNSKWMMPKPQMIALDAGSVVKFKYTGTERLSVNLFETRSYGIRTSEGFGRIVLNLHGDLEYIYLLEEKNESSGKIEIYNEYLKKILTFSQEEKIFNQLKAAAIKKGKEKRINMTNSTIGRLLGMLEVASSLQEFKENMNKIKNNRANDFIKIVEEAEKRSILKQLPEWQYNENKLTNEVKSLFNENKEKLYMMYYKTSLLQLKLENRNSKQIKKGGVNDER